MARYTRTRVGIFLRRSWKDKYYKNSKKSFLGRNEALVYYMTVEEAKRALGDINVYQVWTAKMYRSTSKDNQIKLNEGNREEQNKTVEKSQLKERENTNTKAEQNTEKERTKR